MDVFVHADDFGRSTGVTDSILKTVDCGVVSSVSIMVNGDAYEYALTEWKKRTNLSLTLHFNLVEGYSLAQKKDVPLLVDSNGMFKHSPYSLGFAYYFAGRKKRRSFRKQVALEFKTQLYKLCKDAGKEWNVRIDSHQHVHMLPWIFSIVANEADQTPIGYIRLVREPLYLSNFSLDPRVIKEIVIGYMRVILMGACALYALPVLKRRKIPHNALFLGIFTSGKMNYDVVYNGLSASKNTDGMTEVLFHPGGALPKERNLWEGCQSSFRDWYYSDDRKYELEALNEERLQNLLMAYRSSMFVPLTLQGKISAHMGQIVRFVITGVTAALIHLSVLWVLTELFDIWYVYSSAIGFVFGFIASFTLQKYWTFEDQSREVSVQALKYWILQMFNLFANMVGVYLLVEMFGLWYVLAQFLLLALIAVFTFIISKFLIFSRKTSSEKIEVYAKSL